MYELSDLANNIRGPQEFVKTSVFCGYRLEIEYIVMEISDLGIGKGYRSKQLVVVGVGRFYSRSIGNFRSMTLLPQYPLAMAVTHRSEKPSLPLHCIEIYKSV